MDAASDYMRMLMNKINPSLWPSAIVITLIITPHSQLFAADETTKAWKSGLYGRSTDDTLSSSTIAGLALGFKLNHSMGESILMNAKVGANLESGSSNSLFTDEFAPTNAIYLQNASIAWTIAKPAQLIFGALEQSQQESPLVTAGGTFPAAREILQEQWKQLKTELSAQQAIPTSQRLTSKTVGKAPTPSFFTEKALLQFQTTNDALANIYVSHFSFRNLTNGIAQDSRFYGNSVSGVLSGAQFIYAYHGWEYGTSITHPLSEKVNFSIGASLVKNMGAPDGQNQGTYYFASMDHHSESYTWTPRLEFYRNEADASPAFYTSKEYGHNNRRGYGGSLSVSLLKSKLDIRARYMNAKLITPQTFQRDKFQFMEIDLETPYAIF